ncbi:MAG: hypothetical protein KDA46_09210 [Parvularculaceae bacterium]|nr:hypothetical protein [Parvularculaceae bacterium]
MRAVMVILAGVLAVSCATSARYTLENRFQDIGIPKATAVCMADDLDANLSNEDMRDLAGYTVGLSRAETSREAIDQLLEIENPRAVVAVARSAFTCVTGFNR